MRHRSERLARLRGFARNNTQIKLGQGLRIIRRAQLSMELVCSRNTKTLFTERTSVVRTPHKRPDFRHTRQVCRVQAANGTTPNDADSLHLNSFDIAMAMADGTHRDA